MATGSASKAKAVNLASRQDYLARRVKHTGLIILIVALLLGASAMAVDLRLGLLATAFILGWSQLVGL